jgi:hypothetical protein
MQIFIPVLSLINKFFDSQCIQGLEKEETLKSINKHIKGIDADEVDDGLNKSIGQFMGTVKLRLVNDALIRLRKTIDNIYKAYPCTVVDSDRVDATIKLLLSGHTNSMAGKHLKTVNPMPKDTTEALRSYGA